MTYYDAMTYQEKTTKTYQNFLVKDLKDQCIGINIKQRMRIKTQQMNIDVFSNQSLQSGNCTFYFVKIKIRILKYLKLEDITYQKHY